MKQLLIGLAACFVMTTAQAQIWRQKPSLHSTQAGAAAWDKRRAPSGSIFQLDTLLLLRQLRSAPPEREGAGPQPHPAFVELPYPNGSLRQFRIARYSVMEADLQRKYPQILTFQGDGIDDPAARVYLGWSPVDGLRAVVSSPEGDFFIDPDGPVGTINYRIYEIKDGLETGEFACGALQAREGQPLTLPESRENPCPATKRYLFRLALSCTGEFAQGLLGVKSATAANVLGFMATAIVLRLNHIFERDLSVRLVLAADTDKVIYTDPKTDPYHSGGRIDSLTAEAQETCTRVIGSLNFELGQVLDDLNGLQGKAVGKAPVLGVCNTYAKARSAVYCDFQKLPVYSFFTIAHEVGHLFGANHTFNSCTTNRHATTAFEPGSGTTIMSYASAHCGVDPPLQSNPDPYFHAGSREEILRNLHRLCGGTIDTQNSPPRITAVSFTGSGIIPARTPFLLQGSAMDDDLDPLTYCWEEMDLDKATPWNMPVGNAPLFRSRPPKPSGERSFPDIAVILARYPRLPDEVSLRGEVLPTYSRSLLFRLTVRDGRGGVAASGNELCLNSFHEDITLQVDGDAGPFVVTAPRPRDTITAATGARITWNVADTGPGSRVNCASVQIGLSVDGGVTFPYVLSRSTANDGQEWVTFPWFSGEMPNCRIRIRAEDNIFFAISEEDFTVRPAPAAELRAASNGTDRQSGPAEAVTVFPNPVTKLLWLSRQEPASGVPVELELVTPGGIILLKHTWRADHEAPVDVSRLPAGFYLARLRYNGMVRMRNVLKVSD